MECDIRRDFHGLRHSLPEHLDLDTRRCRVVQPSSVGTAVLCLPLMLPLLHTGTRRDAAIPRMTQEPVCLCPHHQYAHFGRSRWIQPDRRCQAQRYFCFSSILPL